ncbi:MAG: host attachment protein [Epsilonproteobacteria bacterium]|nr:host attachment protein [Campylobacterota bacterium]
MKLENTLVIVADLGELKAYSVKQHEGIVGNEVKISHSLELINDENFIEGRKQISESMSDNSGQFGHDTLEENDLKLEIEKRTLREIAEDIENIVKKIKPKQLFLAFPKEHNRELTNELGSQTKAVLTKNIASDLVKTDKQKILSHFE